MSLLPDAERFRRLVDGSSHGIGSTIARAALGGLAVPYAAAVAIRNAAYDRGLREVCPAGVPVISVGNLTLGGTGKTPMVAWAARSLHEHARRPAIVSRGYGSRPGRASDEAEELAILLPGIDHVANRDRVAAARLAVTRGAGVVVLDDGFQHRRLHRNLDIVAVDATDPFGCGRLFPRGLLREAVGGLGRAQAVVLTRADLVDASERRAIRAAVDAARQGRPPIVWSEAIHRPTRLRSWSGTFEPLAILREARIAACAAIGNPAAFVRTLKGLGAELAGFVGFPDHHAYGLDDLARVEEAADSSRATMVVTTLKDLVKIRRDTLGGRPLWALEIGLHLTENGDALEQALLAASTE